METPAKRPGFNLPPLPLNFTPPPGTPFNDAIIKVGEEGFMKVIWAKGWGELLPCPENPFPPTPGDIIARKYLNKPVPSEREQKLEWQVQAGVFFDFCKAIINNKQRQLLYYFEEGLKQWSQRGRKISLTPEQVLSRWQVKHSDLSMADFAHLYITAKATTLIFKEIAEKHEADYALPNKDEKVRTGKQLPTPTYKTFTDLFVNPADIDPCVNVLNNYENSQNRNGKFKKFVIVAWIDYLDSIKKIHTNKYELVAPVLANEFVGWTIARRTWYDHADGYGDAKKHFTMNIMNIPL